MSAVLIVVATLAFFFPWMSVIADLSYVCLYALVIICMTLPITSEVIQVMMEGTPDSINVEELRADIELECGNDI